MSRNLAIVGFIVGAGLGYVSGGLGTMFLRLGAELNNVALTRMGESFLIFDLQANYLASALILGLVGLLIGRAIGSSLDR